MSPVKPQELRELVPTDEDNICEILVKVMKFMLLYYRHHKYMWDSNGDLTWEWQVDFCERFRFFSS